MPKVTNTMVFLSRPKNSLIYLGLWYFEKRPILYRMFTGLIFISQYSFLFLNLVYLTIVWGDLGAMSEGSYIVFTQSALCFKSTFFVIKTSSIKTLMEVMDSRLFQPMSDVHDKILASHSNTVKMVFTALVVCGMTNCTEWAVIPYLEGQSGMLPFKIWMPVNPNSTTTFLMAYVYEALAVYASAAIFITIDIFVFAMIMFGCAQLDIIMDKSTKIQNMSDMTRLKPKEREDIIDRNSKLLVECIAQHQNVIRFIDLVENTFHVNMFFQLSSTVAIICIICLSIMSEPPNTIQFYATLNYLMTMLAQLYLFCWCGNELTKKSEDVRTRLYQCPWYGHDVKFRRILCIAMECLKRPIIIKAGHYITLSRPTFVSILRCSYSYFAVLNQASK